MSTIFTGVKKDLGLFWQKYMEQDINLRMLDMFALIGSVIFAVQIVLMKVLEVKETPKNAYSVVAPLLMSGIIFAFRSKLSETDEPEPVVRQYVFYALTLGVFYLIVLLFFI